MSLPQLQVSQWFNSKKELSMEDFRGRVLVLEAFQMLCPGCVSHGIPLAQAVHRTFPEDKVAVVGLHTVFEHHAAMTPVSLAAFIHEYRITFPVAVDLPSDTGLPRTMQAFQMRGTPSLLLFDKEGQLRAHHFGEVSELLLGAEIATLLGEAITDTAAQPAGDPEGIQCDQDRCLV